MIDLGGGSLTEPFHFAMEKYDNGNRDVSDKTLRHPSVLTGNVGTLVCVGQSLICPTETDMYNTVNTAKVHNLSIFDGGLYNGQNPTIGGNIYGDGSSWVTRVADALIGDGIFDHVVLMTAGMGGTLISDWGPGGIQHDKLLSALDRTVAFGLTITAILWQQGENDQAIGTTQAAYASGLDSMIGAVRALGHAAPWFLAKSTREGDTVSAGIQAAIDSRINGTDIFAGANTDSIDTTGRHDGTHLNGTGSVLNANMWVAALEAAPIG